jgi:serine/threonine-protein kinase
MTGRDFKPDRTPDGEPEEAGVRESTSRARTTPADGGPAIDSVPSLPAPAELAAGTVLEETYRIIEPIGQGGMGTVYLAEHVELGRRFAVKVLSQAHRVSHKAVARLFHEAKTACAIEHENIVDVVHFGRMETGGVFIVMELLRGQDLQQRLDELRRESSGFTPLPPDESRVVIEQVLSALAAAHKAGVVHRDLKPANVFLARRGEKEVVKVVDFGISKFRREGYDMSLTDTGQILGTPLYMAPEQSRATSDVDARADLYSVGCMAYEVLTGRPPFLAKTPYQCLFMHAHDIAAPPHTLVPSVRASVGDVVMKSLEKEPSARFGSAEEMLRAWQEAWAGISLRPTTDPWPVTEPRPPRRRTRLWAAGGAVVLLGALLVALALVMPDDAPPPSIAEEPPARPALVEERPPAPPPEEAAPPPEEPAAPVDLVRTVRSVPPGATVSIGGERLGPAPREITLPGGRPVEVLLEMRNRADVLRTIGPEDPETVEIPMGPRVGSGGPRGQPELAPLVEQQP